MYVQRAAATIAVLLSALPALAQDVSPSIRQSAMCAPVGGAAPSGAARIALPSAGSKTLYNAGEQVPLDVNDIEGVAVGQRYFVRRPMTFRGAPSAEHTVGRVAIVEVSETRTVARIEMTCDAVAVGDHLEPYAEPVLPAGIERTDATGRLDGSAPITVSYGVDSHQMGGGRDYMLAGSGANGGVVAGARYAIMHGRKTSGDSGKPFAEAIVVSVFDHSALLRITEAHDAVMTGDKLLLRVGSTASTVGTAASPVVIADEQPKQSSGEGSASVRLGATHAATPDQALVFDDVYFDFNRPTLKPAARKLLDHSISVLKEHASVRLSIEGHTCNIGTAEYNLALGERRAKAVRDYLVAHGIDAKRLTTVSYGEDQPKHDNAKQATRKLNRRAALVADPHEAN